MQLEFKKHYSPAVSARLLLPGWVSLGEGHYQGRFVPWRELRLSVCLNCYIMIAAPNLVSGGQLNITYWDLGWPRKHNHWWKEEHYYVPKQNIFQQEYIHVGVGGTTWGMSILNWVPMPKNMPSCPEIANRATRPVWTAYLVNYDIGQAKWHHFLCPESGSWFGRLKLKPPVSAVILAETGYAVKWPKRPEARR